MKRPVVGLKADTRRHGCHVAAHVCPCRLIRQIQLAGYKTHTNQCMHMNFTGTPHVQVRVVLGACITLLALIHRLGGDVVTIRTYSFGGSLVRHTVPSVTRPPSNVALESLGCVCNTSVSGKPA